MIEELTIIGYKSIDKEKLKFQDLTILTGLNSSGKSSVIQTILLISAYTSEKAINIKEFIKDYSDFSINRNRYTNAKEIHIEVISTENEQPIRIQYDSNNKIYIIDGNEQNKCCIFEENLFYISANRIGQEEIASYDENIKFGTNGKYVFGYFEQNKSQPIAEYLRITNADSFTLDSQVSYWFKYILDIHLRINTEKITASQVKVSYDSEGLKDISPFNLGAGNSYVAKILIMGLSCQKGNILIIENPEIHLHPKAQARLADFLNYLASRGIQIILETHSEHIINKTRYNIYKKNISEDQVIIHYKQGVKEPFIPLLINRNGHFININNEEVEFPSGFFDSTLDELLEIM